MIWGLILLLLFLTALATAAEMATYSARPERMQQAIAGGDRRGKMVMAYQRRPASFLSSLQLITTFASFGVGALIGEHFQAPVLAWFQRQFGLAGWVETLSDSLTILGFTIFALIFTNVFPKQIGFVKANEIALASAPPMRIWISVTRPLAWVVGAAVDVLQRLFRVAPAEATRVTEEDIKTLLREGCRKGGIDEREQKIMERILRLSDQGLGTIGTPREKIEWLDLRADWEVLDAQIRASSHSYLAVGEGSLDSLRGVVKSRTWLSQSAQSEAGWADLLLPALELPEGASALEVLEALRPASARCVFLRNMDGQIVRLITLNDAIEIALGPMESIRG